MLVVAVGAHLWLERSTVSPSPERSPIAAAARTPIAGPEREALEAPVQLVHDDVVVDHPVAGAATTRERQRVIGRAWPVFRSAALVNRREPPGSDGAREHAPAIERPAAPAEPPSSEPEALPAVTREAGALTLPHLSAMPVAPPALLTAMMPVREAPPAESRRAPERTEPVDLRGQEEAVLQVLREYTRAYERLDARAVKAVRPSLDDRELQRAFQQLDGQQLRLASCGVSFTGQGANARCKGDAVYRPKVGSRVLRLREAEWTFDLSRGDDGWQIIDARLH